MTRTLIVTALLLGAAPAYAQGSTSAAPSPADQGYMAAMQRMNTQMHAPMTGNPDADFVAGMIPHHQGAIDMAKVELQYGKSKMLRTMAHKIIASQAHEITEMRAWQKRHGVAKAQ